MKLPRMWAEVDLEAIAGNLELLRRLLRPGCQVLGVVKADAYGHGAVEVATTLERRGVTMLGVGDSHEAIVLREHGIRSPILVLGAVVEGEIPDLIHHRIIPTVHSPERIDTFDGAAREVGVRLPVHLLVDTGMSLLGVPPERALEHLESIVAAPNLELDGLGTQFAAPLTDPDLSQLQLARFGRVVETAFLRGLALPTLHAASTAVVLLYPEAHYDCVRVGGLLYGIAPPGRAPQGLTPALSLLTQIVHIRDLPANTPIGYDGTFVTDRPTRVATLAVGYHDGYVVGLSNRAEVLIRGRRAPIIGRVTMDYVTVDITEVRGAEVGDRVTLLGREGDEAITATDLARWAETIPYEIPCHLGQRVRRIYLTADEPGDESTLADGTRRGPMRRYVERIGEDRPRSHLAR